MQFHSPSGVQAVPAAITAPEPVVPVLAMGVGHGLLPELVEPVDDVARLHGR